jgi:hypothetical protein
MSTVSRGASPARSTSNMSAAQNGRGASEMERTRRALIDNGLELTKHPRHGKP